MKQEELLKALIEELFKTDTLHQEYQDNDTHFVIDTNREGDTLNIKVQLLENKDKKEFEDYVDSLPDEIFQEAWENLSEEYELHALNEMYESENNYQEVIDRFKEEVQDIVSNKINELQKLL